MTEGQTNIGHTTIKPTVGRVVHFFPHTAYGGDGFDHPNAGEPCAAVIARVWNDNLVNLTVFDASGNSHSRTSVPLVNPGDTKPQGHFCTWMAYQIGQAAKTQQLEQQIASGNGAQSQGTSAQEPQASDTATGQTEDSTPGSTQDDGSNKEPPTLQQTADSSTPAAS